MITHHPHGLAATETTDSLQRALHESEVQCAHTQQEITGLLYAISHDLRAPLRAISGFSQALQEHAATTLDATGQHYLQRIAQAAQQLTTQIDALLSLSRLSQADITWMELDLGLLCHEVVAELNAHYPQPHPRITIATPMPIRGDARLLKQALRLLLDNAWKCTVNCADPHLEVGCMLQAAQPIFYVRDNGIGFDMSLSHKLFVPFQQLHASSELRGQGLGLASVQRIIARHGGRIWAEAQPGKGAQFYFCLPSHGSNDAT